MKNWWVYLFCVMAEVIQISYRKTLSSSSPHFVLIVYVIENVYEQVSNLFVQATHNSVFSHCPHPQHEIDSHLYDIYVIPGIGLNANWNSFFASYSSGFASIGLKCMYASQYYTTSIEIWDMD